MEVLQTVQGCDSCCLVLVFGLSSSPFYLVFGRYWTTFGLRLRMIAHTAIPAFRAIGGWEWVQCSAKALRFFDGVQSVPLGLSTNWLWHPSSARPGQATWRLARRL